VTRPYYQDDRVALYLGDCREVTDWLAADVLVTDPPYGLNWKRHGGGRTNNRGRDRHEGIVNDEDTSARDTALALWGDRPGVTFGSFDAPEPARRRQTLVWRKWDNAGVLGSTTGFRRDVEPVYLVGSWPARPAHRSALLVGQGTSGGPASPAGRYGHPHAKPLDVMEQLIADCPEGVIADPFAGSGSTLVAARNLGRSAIGVELEERYCEVIAKRLAQNCLDLDGVA
jgi:hypothetical protein